MTRDRSDVAPAAPLLTGRDDRGPGAALAWALVGVYLLLMLGGFLALRTPQAMPRGNEMSADRALFASINAGTLTGFQQTIGVAQSRPLGQAAAMVLTLAGSTLVLVVGGMAVARVVNAPYTDRQIVAASLACEAGAVVFGGGLLLAPGRGVFPSLFQAASAFGNSGLVLGRLPGVNDWQTHAVLVPLALFGSLGVVVLLDLYHWLFGGREMSRFSRIALTATAVAYLLGGIALAVLHLPWEQLLSKDGVVTPAAWIRTAAASSIHAINTRSAGLPYAWDGGVRATQWVVILFMLLGGVSGSAAGGVKLTTVVELLRGARRSLRGETAGRLFGIAAVWLAAYAALAFLALVLLVLLETDVPADRLVFLAVSAASNVGLSHDAVSMTGTGLIVLSATMLLGRMLPLLMLWWAARSVRGADNAVG